jgi:hypothetical protein
VSGRELHHRLLDGLGLLGLLTLQVRIVLLRLLAEPVKLLLKLGNLCVPLRGGLP